MLTIRPSLCRCSNCGRIFIGLKTSGGVVYKESKTDLCSRCLEDVKEIKDTDKQAVFNQRKPLVILKGLFKKQGTPTTEEDRVAVDYLMQNLPEETHLLAQVVGHLRENYTHGDDYIRLLSRKVSVEDALLAAQTAQDEGHHFVANTIFEELVKQKENPYAYLGLAHSYANGLGRSVAPDKAAVLYKEAFRAFEKEASEGKARALFEIGVCYRRGEGVEQSDKKAVEYYKSALAGGCLDAANNLGLMYAEGLGVEKDAAEAVRYYRIAAEAGNADSQTLLAKCYYQGVGVDQDFDEAFAWFQKAADQGEPDALFQVALCYHDGHGVEPDNDQVVDYLFKAAEAGHQHALELLKENGLVKEEE